METGISDLRRDIKNLVTDMALIKNILIEKEELSDWTLNELEESRKIPESECVSQEEVRKIILQK